MPACEEWFARKSVGREMKGHMVDLYLGGVFSSFFLVSPPNLFQDQLWKDLLHFMCDDAPTMGWVVSLAQEESWEERISCTETTSSQRDDG